MSEFSSEFWGLAVAVATLVSVIGCAVFLKAQSVKRVPAERAGGRTETTGHVWDEDLGEYTNPLPRWWAWLFYITIFFSLGYLVLYPGLGGYKGVLGWTQLGQLEGENRKADAAYGPLYERLAAQEVTALAKNPEALAIGQKLFLNHCAQCHASDGGGSPGFPSLADRDWLWGGTPEAIKASIAEGRTGVMPPFGPTLGEQAVGDLQHYVVSLSGNAHDSIRRARGAALYRTACVACHGAEGKGNPALGAPDLTDGIWLHGYSGIADTIAKGRTSQMPAHKDLLSPAKIHLLTAYVLSLQGGPPK
jgi:cytochrome c oxidase cbb3-type subunit 3